MTPLKFAGDEPVQVDDPRGQERRDDEADEAEHQ
jgi:hypothetical protein